MPEIADYLDSVLDGEFSPDQRAFISRLMADFIADHYIPNRSDYRIAAERLLRLLYIIDERMSRSRQPQRDWQQIALALRLPSARYLQLTEAKIGRSFGVTKMAISKSVTKVLRAANRIALQ